MARTVSIGLLTAFVLAACSGSDDSTEPATTTAASVTTSLATTTSVAPTTTAASTTTTVEATTTTVDEAALIAEIEQAYFDAFDAYHAAIFDPADETLRAALEETHADEGLASVLQALDDLIELNAIARTNPDFGAAKTEITGPVRFENDDRTSATLVVCQLNSEWFVEPGAGPGGEDSILRSDVIRVDQVVELRSSATGAWKLVGGGNAVELIGEEECAGQ